MLMTALPDHVWCKILSLSMSNPSLLPSSDQLALLAEQLRLLELRWVWKGFDKIGKPEHSLLLWACIPGSINYRLHLLANLFKSAQLSL